MLPVQIPSMPTKGTVRLAVALFLLHVVCGGCSSPSSRSSPTSVRDPLGVEKDIHDYYFPEKRQAPNATETSPTSGA